MTIQTAWPLLLAAGVRWVPGMLDTTGRRVSWIDEETGYHGGLTDGDGRIRPLNSACYIHAVPDLSDLPTVYALLGELRRVTGEPCAYLWPDETGMEWDVYARTSHSQNTIMGPSGPTEGAAVFAALCSWAGVDCG